VAEFIPGSSKPIFSTYIGGESADKIYSIAVDSYQNIYATGATASKNFPITKNAIDKSLDDKTNTSDCFMFKLTADGKTLKYSTYLGGRNEDVANSIALLRDYSAYIVGSTASPDFPHSAYSFDTTINDTSKSDAFIVRIIPEQFEVYAGGRVNLCSGDSAQVGTPATGGVGALSYLWSPNYRISNNKSEKCYVFPDTSMIYSVTVTDALGRTCSDTVFVSVSGRISKWIFGPRYVYPGVTVTYRAIGDGPAECRWTVDGGEVISGQGSPIVRVHWTTAGQSRLTLETVAPSGCVYRAGVMEVRAGDLFRPVIYPPYVEPFCSGDSVVLDAGPDYWNIEWSDGRRGRYDTVTVYGDYWARMVYGADTALVSDTIHIEIGEKPPRPSFVILPDSLYCLEQAERYQWYYRNAAIPGGTGRAHKPKYIGYYRVETINGSGCGNISDSLFVPVLPSVQEVFASDFKLFPNPADETASIEGYFNKFVSIDIAIFDCFGRECHSEKAFCEGAFEHLIDLSGLADGVYFVRLCSSGDCITQKLIKLKR
jgi:hypothetical protein